LWRQSSLPCPVEKPETNNFCIDGHFSGKVDPGWQMVVVRLCSPSDLRRVFEIAEKHASFDTAPTLVDIDGMRSRNPDYFFVAEDDSGEVIGFITGYERMGLSEDVLRTWNAGSVGYVELIAVDSRYRRKGIGRALLKTLLNRFQSSGIDIVDLDVPAEQEAAVELYKKLGFYVRACNMRKRLV